MKRWHVYATVTGGKYLGIFTAPTKSAALDLAQQDACASMCHQCSSECEDPVVEVTDAHLVQEGDS